MANGLTEALLRRERLWVGVGLALLCLLSWYYLLLGAGTGMSTVAMTTWQFPPPAYDTSGGGQWPLQYWLIMFAMWWVMMIAMMVPSAAPMILLYARVQRHHDSAARVPVASFLAGYLLSWLLFSLLATGIQWLLERLGLVHGMMMWSVSTPLSAVFLLLAGLYQFSPLKQRCLQHCRGPASFLSAHWRQGSLGALRMGFEHGLFCVGCCWVLMLLLFVGGTMNLVWIAGLAILVLLEKLLPNGETVSTVVGLALIVTSGWLALSMVPGLLY